MKDYYAILTVSRNAPDEEIKKAYRRLAHQYHPDKIGGDGSKFKELNEAYQILGNKEKRAQYDFALQQISQPRVVIVTQWYPSNSTGTNTTFYY